MPSFFSNTSTLCTWLQNRCILLPGFAAHCTRQEKVMPDATPKHGITASLLAGLLSGGEERCASAKMGVATARQSNSVRQTLWRTNILAVGRFGGEGLGALESTVRQTHPTCYEGTAPTVRWVWRQPASLTAYGRRCGVRISSQSGGLAERAWEHWKAPCAKHTQRTGERCANRSY